jgi:hypothetical protein
MLRRAILAAQHGLQKGGGWHRAKDAAPARRGPQPAGGPHWTVAQAGAQAGGALAGMAARSRFPPRLRAILRGPAQVPRRPSGYQSNPTGA